MSTNPSFNPRLVGQTEAALGAVLDRQLRGTGLGAPQWMTLTMAIASGGNLARDQLAYRVASARKVSEAEARGWIDELATAQLVQAPDEEGARVSATDTGLRLQEQIGSAIAQVTHQLWGDLPAADLAIAARVLSTVLARANEQHSTPNSLAATTRGDRASLVLRSNSESRADTLGACR